jgi:hypothetical protein
VLQARRGYRDRVRQLINWRFFAALAALAGLVFLLNRIVADDDPIAEVLDATVQERDIDLIAPLFSIEKSDDFAVRPNGLTKGYADFVIDASRIVRVAPGTPGEVTCEELDGLNQCAVFADLLGEAVVWFAVVPQAPRSTAELPPIVDLDGGDAVFVNGWRIPYPPVIERECGDEDIPTFADFLRRFGPDSTSIVDLETQLVVSVRCGAEVVREDTTTATAPGVDLGEVVDTDVVAPDG